MKLFFSLVLFKNSVVDISQLLLSINSLQCTFASLDCTLLVYDASPSGYSSHDIDAINLLIPDVEFDYNLGVNIGYGMANNYNFRRIDESSDFLFIVVNPDVYFLPHSIYPLFEWSCNNPAVSCVAPLIVNQYDQIQFSAKRNPTFLSLLLGRFSLIARFQPFRLYDDWHKQLNRDYTSEIFASTYLSGCFLIIPDSYYRLVGGFSPSYFLHLEDADLVRRLSEVGNTLHNPLGRICHLWARGSHKSCKQMLYLLNSYISYVMFWGFDLL